MNEHEAKFVESFVIKAKQDRFREALISIKHRRKMVESLDHSSDLNFELAIGIPRDKQSPLEIHSLLQEKAAPQLCYVISANENIDGKEMDLVSALRDIVGYGDGTFLSCIPGKLGYYESAEQGRRMIFEKK